MKKKRKKKLGKPGDHPDLEMILEMEMKLGRKAKHALIRRQRLVPSMPAAISRKHQKYTRAHEMQLARPQRLAVRVQRKWHHPLPYQARAELRRVRDIVRKQARMPCVFFLVPTILDRRGLEQGVERRSVAVGCQALKAYVSVDTKNDRCQRSGTIIISI